LQATKLKELRQQKSKVVENLKERGAKCGILVGRLQNYGTEIEKVSQFSRKSKRKEQELCFQIEEIEKQINLRFIQEQEAIDDLTAVEAKRLEEQIEFIQTRIKQVKSEVERIKEAERMKELELEKENEELRSELLHFEKIRGFYERHKGKLSGVGAGTEARFVVRCKNIEIQAS
jgi:chromosome segregation ATPase